MHKQPKTTSVGATTFVLLLLPPLLLVLLLLRLQLLRLQLFHMRQQMWMNY